MEKLYVRQAKEVARTGPLEGLPVEYATVGGITAFWSYTEAAASEGDFYDAMPGMVGVRVSDESYTLRLILKDGYAIPLPLRIELVDNGVAVRQSHFERPALIIPGDTIQTT